MGVVHGRGNTGMESLHARSAPHAGCLRCGARPACRVRPERAQGGRCRRRGWRRQEAEEAGRAQGVPPKRGELLFVPAELPLLPQPVPQEAAGRVYAERVCR
eukprot:980754-Prymnesium_polylepis.1